jgi:hypothetical protein
MTSMMIIRPMDAEGKRLRRQRVEDLAQRVREYQAAGTWARSEADLELSELEWEVGGMSRHIEALLIEIFDEHDGRNVHRTLLDGTLPEEHVEGVLTLLAERNMHILAQRAIVLHQLVVAARAALDTLITAPHGTEVHGPLAQAVAAIVAAEHAGELRQAKALREQLANDAELQAAGAEVALGRARRDQARQVALGLIAPPRLSVRERVLAALRGVG